MKSKIVLLVALCVACAIAQEEVDVDSSFENVPPIDTTDDGPVSDVAAVANDVASNNDEDAPSANYAVDENEGENGNEEATVSDDEVESNPEATPEPQENTNTETGPSDAENQENEENATPSDNSDAQNNGEDVADVTTSASSVDGGDSSVDNASETDSNSSTESTDDTATTNAPESATDEPVAPVTDAPAPAPEEPTPEFTCQSVGRFPYPDSCEKYYFCWDTVHSYAVFTCPKVFDPVSMHCVNNYAVCPLAPTCEADKQVLPFPDDKTAFFICKLEKDKEAVTPVYEIRKEDCEEGREFDAELGYCRLITSTDWTSSESGSSERFECDGVGTFIDYSSETHYIECVLKSVSKGTLKAIRRKCPKHTVFSAVDKQCIPL